MAETFRFFNSVTGDIREYQASEFAEYFGMFIPDGVFVENSVISLGLTNATGLQVRLATGFASIRGYLYKNDAVKSFTLDAADTILNRIDRVVIKLDISNRTIAAVVKKGTLGSSPVPPSLIDTTSVKEIPIAQIRINAKATTGVITDERVAIPSLKDIGVRIFNGPSEPTTIRTGDIWLKEV